MLVIFFAEVSLDFGVFALIEPSNYLESQPWLKAPLGALIIVNIVFFQQGILGWAQEKWPERFGIRVEGVRVLLPDEEHVDGST